MKPEELKHRRRCGRAKRLAIIGCVSLGVLVAGPVLAQAGSGGLSAPPPTPPVSALAPSGRPTPLPGYRPQSVHDGVQVETPYFQDTLAVLDNLPTSPPAKPKRPRKVLVFCVARGYVHSVIPLTAFAIKALGENTGAWETTVTYRLQDFTAERLASYDVVVLNNTSGAFLDDADAVATLARRAALLNYVRGGHGLVLTHAAGDSYHTGVDSPGGPQSLWPEYTRMVGGFFKWHWFLPQRVTVRIDDPASPINAAFAGRPFTIHDEIYTFEQASFSRKNVRVLTSVDYSRMSPEDQAKEPASTRRTDGDYALSWIRREGQGRIYYNALGHSEHVLSMPAILQQLTAGIQYAAGDLPADDSPSAR